MLLLILLVLSELFSSFYVLLLILLVLSELFSSFYVLLLILLVLSELFSLFYVLLLILLVLRELFLVPIFCVALRTPITVPTTAQTCSNHSFTLSARAYANLTSAVVFMSCMYTYSWCANITGSINLPRFNVPILVVHK